MILESVFNLKSVFEKNYVFSAVPCIHLDVSFSSIHILDRQSVVWAMPIFIMQVIIISNRYVKSNHEYKCLISKSLFLKPIIDI